MKVTMNVDLLQALCKGEGVKICPLLVKLDISCSQLTAWRHGIEPRTSEIMAIASYFGLKDPMELFIIDQNPGKDCERECGG